MTRLTRHRKSLVSNRLALFAAFLLIGSTLAGVNRSTPFDTDIGVLAAATTAEAASGERAIAFESAPRKKNKRFKVSLLLLRLR